MIKECAILLLGVAVASSTDSITSCAADLDRADGSQASLLSTGSTTLSDWYIHLGPAAVIVDAGAKIRTPAGPVPGATVRVAPAITATADIGYHFTPNWALSATLGVPPTADVEGAGSVRDFGKLGSTLYGPLAVTGHYHFTTFGAFQPYVGGGPVYMISLNSHDGALTDFQVRSAWGAVAQAGADIMLTDHIGVFADVKKAYLRTTARANLGPVPVTADVKLDPVIISGGLTYRF